MSTLSPTTRKKRSSAKNNSLDHEESESTRSSSRFRASSGSRSGFASSKAKPPSSNNKLEPNSFSSTVDQEAPTEMEQPRSSRREKTKSSQQELARKEQANLKRSSQTRNKKNRWQRVDRIFTWSVPLCLLLAVGWVCGVNWWSRQHGAEDVHPLSVSHLSERTKACWWYLHKTWGPPTRKPSSLGYEREIQEASLRFQVHPALLKAMIAVESNFLLWKTDRFGAMGLMQITPHVASHYGHAKDAFDPATNIAMGARFLKKQQAKYVSLEKSILAYYREMRGLPVVEMNESLSYVRRVKNKLLLFQQDPGYHIRQAMQEKKNPVERWSLRKVVQRIRKLF